MRTTPKQAESTEQDQIDSLSQEVLDLYRQVNLLYRLGDVFRAGLSSDEVVSHLVKECRKVVRARAFHVVLKDGREFGRAPQAPQSEIRVQIESPTASLGVLSLYDKRQGPFSAADEKQPKPPHSI